MILPLVLVLGGMGSMLLGFAVIMGWLVLGAALGFALAQWWKWKRSERRQ